MLASQLKLADESSDHHAGSLVEARRERGIAEKTFLRYGMAAGAERAAHALAQLKAGAPGPAADAFFGSPK
ncbi:MAG: hypothetical protein ABI156_15280 [Caldimonas sp.]